jgi:methylthioribose-1-phosphate isomerase
MRTVEWDYALCQVRLIDQRVLPERFEVVSFSDYHQLAEAIRNMTVRGAPAIGATGAFGLALAAQTSHASEVAGLIADLEEAAQVLGTSRPTAVNLNWALKRVMDEIRQASSGIDTIRQQVLTAAQRIADEDVAANRRMAEWGEPLIQDGDTIIHHCNTGSLATVDWGTALGVIRLAYERGKRIHVLVDETRPRLQGARLTAWELQQYGISYDIISDNMAGFFLRTGQAQKVFFGADRVTANGDVANKVGSYMLALAAYDNGIPVYSVFPTSTIDLNLQQGSQIPIEEREEAEVLELTLNGERVMPDGAHARNPAFDITPARLISGLVTEMGVVYPPFNGALAKIVSA